MNSKQISYLLLLLSFSLAACAPPPKEVAPAQPAATQAPAPSAGGSGVAVGHDAAPAASAQGDSAASVKWTAPARWEAKPASGMRLATYLIPAAKGDSEGGECAVFGNMIGGGVEANIKRWIGQFEKTDAEPKQKKETINGFDVTTVDALGAFKGGGPMMGQSGGPKAGYRLLGAIVETPQGEIYFKLTGPAKTVAAAQGEFQAMLKSLKK